MVQVKHLFLNATRVTVHVVSVDAIYVSWCFHLSFILLDLKEHEFMFYLFNFPILCALKLIVYFVGFEGA
jgi:hypothetical protein